MALKSKLLDNEAVEPQNMELDDETTQDEMMVMKAPHKFPGGRKKIRGDSKKLLRGFNLCFFFKLVI